MEFSRSFPSVTFTVLTVDLSVKFIALELLSETLRNK